jgi:hypothetical protein
MSTIGCTCRKRPQVEGHHTRPGKEWEPQVQASEEQRWGGIQDPTPAGCGDGSNPSRRAQERKKAQIALVSGLSGLSEIREPRRWAGLAKKINTSMYQFSYCCNYY